MILEDRTFHEVQTTPNTRRPSREGPAAIRRTRSKTSPGKLETIAAQWRLYSVVALLMTSRRVGGSNCSRLVSTLCSPVCGFFVAIFGSSSVLRFIVLRMKFHGVYYCSQLQTVLFGFVTLVQVLGICCGSFP
jgi:hypothetical protein